MSHAKIYMGSWCFGLGQQRPATLEQIVITLSAFGYDGIGLAGGFVNHVSIERYPDKASRHALRNFIHEHGLEIPVYAADPYSMPWATEEGAFADYQHYFRDSLELACDLGAPSMRVDPGSFGPLAVDVDYRQIWQRVVSTFQSQAQQAANLGITLLWEPETAQIFVRPGEIIGILDEVDHPNFKLHVDFAHAHAIAALGHNQSQPRELLEDGAHGFIRQAGRHIGDVGVNDTDGNIVDNVFASHLGLGRGRLDIEGLVADVIASGFRGPWWGVDSIPLSDIVWSDAWRDGARLRQILDRQLS